MDTLLSLLRLFRALLDWRVILDVLLIAAILFFLYRTLLRLGTWKIVTGIFLALVVFVAANVLDLKGMNWIYSNLSQVAAIALIVIFQPELRKIFERAASLGGRKLDNTGPALAALFGDAAFLLANKRRGALIVLPGREPVKRWLSGGFDLYAEPSLPIILSIFDPNSPGHDGALVFRNGKLAYFGVRLPISKTGRLTEEFGTRHHAAMGLSEVTDALVIAVSEERGTVKTFLNGMVKKVDGQRELAKQILSHWQTASSSGIELNDYRKQRNLIPEMAISLALALVFYSTVIVSTMEIREKAFTVPVEYIAAPQNLALRGDNPTEIKLQLTGPKSELDKINPANLSVKIDLSQAKAGGQVFVVSKENISLPRGVKLVNANPSSISLSLEEIAEFEVEIQPQLVGTLPQGLELVSVELNPKELQVLSPPIDPSQKISIVTEPIYLESINKNEKVLRKVIAPPNVRPKGKNWPDIEITIKVRPKT
ncbi:MAG: diadenylate cyclase [Deltaproteobacteria bacterium]|nr:diadenylate cyclase [Deltaproteobacteria bacterium]